MRATRIATPATASRGDGRGGPPAQVKVQLHVSKTRVMKIMRGYDTAASGWVSASDLALGLKRLGLSNDYVTVLLKQLDSETIRDQNMVDYKRFFATITVRATDDKPMQLCTCHSVHPAPQAIAYPCGTMHPVEMRQWWKCPRCTTQRTRRRSWIARSALQWRWSAAASRASCPASPTTSCSRLGRCTSGRSSSMRSSSAAGVRWMPAAARW